MILKHFTVLQGQLAVKIDISLFMNDNSTLYIFVLFSQISQLEK